MKNIILRKTLRQHALLGCLMLLPLSSVCLQASAQQIAFPGAEGWGRFATGGRATDPAIGSKVYYVTSLEDYLSTEEPIEGTLRWALSTGDDTPRTILFKVGGTINLLRVVVSVSREPISTFTAKTLLYATYASVPVICRVKTTPH